MPEFDWNSQRDEVFSHIASTKGFLKILLKTRNDAPLLHGWIEHHRRIAGVKNLIIFDNMSSDVEVLKIYQENCDIPVVRYDGFHNHVHNVEIFPDLYQSLRLSCDYFVFLDTDERLALIQDGFFYDDQRIFAYLKSRPDVDCFPGTWLNNSLGCASIFDIGWDKSVLDSGLRWGKPIVRSGASLDHIIMHNSQIPSELYSPNTPNGIICLHLKNLFPDQRIRSNMHKLQRRGFIVDVDDVEAALDRDVSTFQDGMIAVYLDEIRRLREAGSGCVELSNAGQVELALDGQLRFYDSESRARFLDFFGCGRTEALVRNLGQRVIL
jgi:hypothetical protein